MIASTTMLYRPAEQPNPDVWNAYVEHRAFADGDVAAALAEGWALHPKASAELAERAAKFISAGQAGEAAE